MTVYVWDVYICMKVKEIKRSMLMLGVHESYKNDKCIKKVCYDYVNMSMWHEHINVYKYMNCIVMQVYMKDEWYCMMW